MDNVLLLDAARLAHLVGLAMGLGLALCADAIALKSCFRPITALDVRLLSMIHRVIMVALGVLWASGLMLLTFRTGWDLAAFTPKLVMKLCVVVLLTLNAIIIGIVAMPTYRANLDRLFGQIEQPVRLWLSVIAGLSLSCWFSALALGVFSQLKPLPFDVLGALFLPVFLLGLLGAVTVGLSVGPFARATAWNALCRDRIDAAATRA